MSYRIISHELTLEVKVTMKKKKQTERTKIVLSQTIHIALYVRSCSQHHHHCSPASLRTQLYSYSIGRMYRAIRKIKATKHPRTNFFRADFRGNGNGRERRKRVQTPSDGSSEENASMRFIISNATYVRVPFWLCVHTWYIGTPVVFRGENRLGDSCLGVCAVMCVLSCAFFGVIYMLYVYTRCAGTVLV